MVTRFCKADRPAYTEYRLLHRTVAQHSMCPWYDIVGNTCRRVIRVHTTSSNDTLRLTLQRLPLFALYIRYWCPLIWYRSISSVLAQIYLRQRGYVFVSVWVLIIMACPRPLYFAAVVSIFLLSFFCFSSPNLNGRRLDVYHTSTHDVALVRI